MEFQLVFTMILMWFSEELHREELQVFWALFLSAQDSGIKFLCTAWEFPLYFPFFFSFPLFCQRYHVKLKSCFAFSKTMGFNPSSWLMFYHWTQQKNKSHIPFKVKEQKLTRATEHEWILILFIIHRIFSFSFSIAPHNPLPLLYINIISVW